jgi:hypothetical protein
MRSRLPAPLAPAFAEAVRLVAADYARFLHTAEAPDAADSAAFRNRHIAARACLAHLVDLLGLIGEEAAAETLRDGFALLHEAHRALDDATVPEEAADERVLGG